MSHECDSTRFRFRVFWGSLLSHLAVQYLDTKRSKMIRALLMTATVQSSHHLSWKLLTYRAILRIVSSLGILFATDPFGSYAALDLGLYFLGSQQTF